MDPSTLDTWHLVALAGTLGWASGIRLYAVLFIVGGLGYLGWIPLPGALDLLAASFTMFVVEFFADKVPVFDSFWDTLQTFVRIPAGAALAASVFGDASGATALAAAVVGGTLAAGSHLTKAGGRMAINTSPEPFSNVATSLGEDVAVGVLLWLAFEHPLVALALLAFIVLLMIWLIPKLWRFVARLFRGGAQAPGARTGDERPAPMKR